MLLILHWTKAKAAKRRAQPHLGALLRALGNSTRQLHVLGPYRRPQLAKVAALLQQANLPYILMGRFQNFRAIRRP